MAQEALQLMGLSAVNPYLGSNQANMGLQSLGNLARVRNSLLTNNTVNTDYTSQFDVQNQSVSFTAASLK